MRTIDLFFLCLFGLTVCLTNSVTGRPASHVHKFDDEYDRFKKSGDDFFKQGRYEDARRRYQLCLTVPGFANDPYAKDKIAQCDRLISLNRQAETAQKDGKQDLAVNAWEQVLGLNSEDPATKSKLADYWVSQGTVFYNKQQYADAKSNYQKALTYRPGDPLLLAQIRNCDTYLAQQVKPNPTPATTTDNTITQAPTRPKTTKTDTPNPIPLTVKKSRGLPKILVAVAGAGAGYYAYYLHNDYQTKLTALNAVSQRVDPANTSLIVSPSDYILWESSYAEAEAAYNKKGLATTFIGIAAVAVVAEAYLLIHKPKAKMHVGLSSQTYGLAVKVKL